MCKALPAVTGAVVGAAVVPGVTQTGPVYAAIAGLPVPSQRYRGCPL